MMNLNISQATHQPYVRKTYMQKQEDANETMGARIELPYKPAVGICKMAIESDEKLKSAFLNFQEMKGTRLQDLPSDKEVLIGAYLDNFKKGIFIVLKKGEDFSHYFLNNSTGKFVKYAKNIAVKPNLPLELSNIKLVTFTSDGGNLERSWVKSKLKHTIQNEDGISLQIKSSLNNSISENNPYVSDESYPKVVKSFKYLTQDIEKNKFNEVSMISKFNPAHTIIDPKDLIEHKTSTSKNARKV